MPTARERKEFVRYYQILHQSRPDMAEQGEEIFRATIERHERPPLTEDERERARERVRIGLDRLRLSGDWTR